LAAKCGEADRGTELYAALIRRIDKRVRDCDQYPKREGTPLPLAGAASCAVVIEKTSWKRSLAFGGINRHPACAKALRGSGALGDGCGSDRDCQPGSLCRWERGKRRCGEKDACPPRAALLRPGGTPDPATQSPWQQWGLGDVAAGRSFHGAAFAWWEWRERLPHRLLIEEVTVRGELREAELRAVFGPERGSLRISSYCSEAHEGTLEARFQVAAAAKAGARAHDLVVTGSTHEDTLMGARRRLKLGLREVRQQLTGTSEVSMRFTLALALRHPPAFPRAPTGVALAWHNQGEPLSKAHPLGKLKLNEARLLDDLHFVLRLPDGTERRRRPRARVAVHVRGPRPGAFVHHRPLLLRLDGSGMLAGEPPRYRAWQDANPDLLRENGSYRLRVAGSLLLEGEPVPFESAELEVEVGAEFGRPTPTST